MAPQNALLLMDLSILFLMMNRCFTSDRASWSSLEKEADESDFFTLIAKFATSNASTSIAWRRDLIEIFVSVFLCLNAYNMDISEENVDLVCKKSHRLVSKSLEMNMDPFVVYALIYHESRWKNDAVSKAGACGLTQVMPRWTGEMTGGMEYSCDDLLVPRNSIRAGLHALDYWLMRAKGDIERGLCAYNAGNRCLATNHPGRSNYSRMVLRTAGRLQGDWNRVVVKFEHLFYETATE